jgi:hypothetical protein
MNQSSPFWVRHAALVFSVKTFAAAMLALVTALLLDMPRPYWAMATVYITAQPLVGATISKAVYRIIGTVIGAAAAVVAIPNFVNAPELLCLAIASWVGVCLYLSLLDGTPRSYAFILAGYTVAVIGFPSVSAPETVFDTAVARVQEISLGIVYASLVSMLVLPRTVSGRLFRRGFRNVFLRNVRPLGSYDSVMVGPAYTLRFIPAREDLDGFGVKPDPNEIQREAFESVPRGHVLVMDCREETRAASCGDILVTRLLFRGGAGIVSDGGVRDSALIAKINLPVFCAVPSPP